MRINVVKPFESFRHKKLRVCAYVRVSTDSLEQADSLENQTETYKRRITSNPEYDFAGVYSDQGITGYSEKRPGFMAMMDKARNGEIDLIIVKSISRFARNTVTVLKAARELKEIGVGIFFEEQNINTLTSEGEMMLAVMASFAQEESRSMSENMKWTFRKKFERGEIVINAKRFMGYDKDEKEDLVINEEEARTVRMIFDLYLKGYGSHRIAKKLNSESIGTVTGAKWSDTAILNMLKNEKYKGDYILQKYYTPENTRKETRLNKGEEQSYYIKDNHPAIISPEDWNKVQEIIEKRRPEKDMTSKRRSKYVNMYPLSGLLICPLCGSTLKRRMSYKKRIEWWCSKYIKEGKAACRGVKIIDELIQHRTFNIPMVIEEEIKNGKKHYRYTSKEEYFKYGEN